MYAKSADFAAAFTQAEMEKLSKAANGDDTDIFTAPPKGYTIVRLVPATSDFNVLTGLITSKYLVNLNSSCRLN